MSKWNPTFSDYASYVLRLKLSLGLKRTTHDRYLQMLERILPAIGSTRIKAITPRHLNELYIKLSEEGENRRTGAKLSAKTVLEHHRLVSSILAQAVREGFVSSNVASRATKPKARKHKADYFQPEVLQQILRCLSGEPLKWQAATQLLMMSGARRGEIAGLKWSDVDFDRNTVAFRSSLLYLPKEGVFEDTLKNDESERTVTLPSATMLLLKKYREWHLDEKQKKFSVWETHDFVLTAWDGRPMHPDSITDWLAKFSKRHQLPHVHPHAFRHTMASLLYRAGVDGVTISKRLGHANVSTTANIYSHIIRNADEDAAKRLAELFDE